MVGMKMSGKSLGAYLHAARVFCSKIFYGSFHKNVDVPKNHFEASIRSSFS